MAQRHSSFYWRVSYKNKRDYSNNWQATHRSDLAPQMSYLKCDFCQTSGAFNIKAEDGQPQIQLILYRLFASIKLLPFVYILSTCLTPERSILLDYNHFDTQRQQHEVKWIYTEKYTGAPKYSITTHLPHVKWGHQSNHILTIFREFQFRDFGWIKIRGIVFLKKEINVNLHRKKKKP